MIVSSQHIILRIFPATQLEHSGQLSIPQPCIFPYKTPSVKRHVFSHAFQREDTLRRAPDDFGTLQL
jgi:hypothetical protein